MATMTNTMPFVVGKRKPNTVEPVYDLKRQLAARELLKKYEPKKTEGKNDK